MWPSPLFRRIAFSLIGLGWIALALGMWVIARDQREFAVMAQQRQLAAAAARLGDRLPEDFAAAPPDSLTAEAAELAAEIDVAFAIVGTDGRVLAGAGDAAVQREAREGTKVAHRPALVKAARYGQGFARARTTSDGDVPAQCALRVDRAGRTAGFVCALDVRPAPMPGADSWRRAGAWSAALIAALATPLAWRLSRRVTSPLATLTRAVKQLGDGNYDWRTAAPRQPELRDLASAIDRMSRAVRRREALLRENLERRETVLSGMLEGVIAVDQEERVLFANAAAGKLLDFAPREVEQRTLLEAVRCHPLRTLVRDALGSGEPRRREVKFLGPPSRELEVHAMPLRGQPCPGVILVIDDLTHMRRLESARQQFISNVSHELKTPLSSIKAYTETLLGGARHDPEHCERFLGRIAEQAERLHQLILDMLSLARIESGQAALELSDVDVAEVAARSVAAHEALAAAKGVALVDETASALATVRADDEGLREILDNLIDNAVKYTPPGGRVVVRARAIDRYVAVEVEDTGVGIPPEHLDRVFERFYRVDKARSRELGGTGLGLSIVKHLAQAMGGQVGVESEPGRGSVFSVRLPLANVAPPISANS